MTIDTNPTATGLIIAGLLAPLVYAAIVLVGAARRPGYSHVANAVSELVEAGAPHRAGLNAAFFLYNALAIAFGIGITVLAANPTLTLSGWLLAITGAAGVVMAWFPMDPIGRPATLPGRGHLILAGLMSVGTMAAILAFAIGAATLPGWEAFSVFSYAAFAVVLVTGGTAALSAGGHWPTMGVWERLTIGSYLVWQALAAIMFLTA